MSTTCRCKNCSMEHIATHKRKSPKWRKRATESTVYQGGSGGTRKCKDSHEIQNNNRLDYLKYAWIFSKFITVEKKNKMVWKLHVLYTGFYVRSSKRSESTVIYVKLGFTKCTAFQFKLFVQKINNNETFSVLKIISYHALWKILTIVMRND